ncbi:hypothetical protein PJP10_32175, partial [Mycobacterium kansasii]
KQFIDEIFEIDMIRDHLFILHFPITIRLIDDELRITKDTQLLHSLDDDFFEAYYTCFILK